MQIDNPFQGQIPDATELILFYLLIIAAALFLMQWRKEQ